MSAFAALFDNADLIGKDGQPIKASSLDGKGAVGIYFSAHWCGPCRLFTPQLVDFYKQLKADGKDFEIVFVSSDRDEASFDGYYGEMPWLALNFASRDVKAKLSKLYGVQGIPTFVMLDGKAEVITKSGRDVVDEDPRGKQFPWTPMSLQEALGDTFVKGDTTITAESLKGKTVALYFSAHWCGPCRQFTPRLAATYRKLEEAGKPFEVIFVSSDQDQKSFDEYRATMPWAALPFERRDAKASLSTRFDVDGIPSLIVLESIESGRVINPNGRSAVAGDPEGLGFPWHPQALNNLAAGADGINENPCVVALLGGADASPESEAGVRAVADRHYAAARAAGKMHAAVRFFFASDDTGTVTQRIRQLTKTGGRTLVLLDIPDDGGFYEQAFPDGPITADAVDTLLAGYEAKALERKTLS